MSSSRLLDFFVLEASDYIDRLDSILAESATRGPDPEALTAQARLLRGSATMARQSPIADLASALERIGRAMRDGIIEWNEGLRSALIAAVDDLKILVRAVRNWGAGDDRRTESRLSELVSLYPQAQKSHPTPPSNNIRNASFIASETAQLATALDTLVAHPSTPESLGIALHRLSSLRGVAAINDTPPLPQVLLSIEDVLKPLHARSALPETQHLGVLSAAVQLLRRFSQEIAIGGRPDPSSQQVAAFNAALGGLGQAEEPPMDDGDVVPISHLNFEDGLPQLVTASQSTSHAASNRFRLEVVGACEHLRHQVALARAATDEFSRGAAQAAVRAALRALRATAAGFDDGQVITFADTAVRAFATSVERALGLADELAATLLDAERSNDQVHDRLGALLEAHRAANDISRALEPEAAQHSRAESAQAPVTAAAPHLPPPSAPPNVPDSGLVVQHDPQWEDYDVEPLVGSEISEPLSGVNVIAVRPESSGAEPARGPDTAAAHRESELAAAPAWSEPESETALRGAGLSAALQMGIASFSDLDANPLSQPAHVQEDDLVPIEELLYRGRDAISRALEIRDDIRTHSRAPRSDELNELFELLDLALTE